MRQSLRLTLRTLLAYLDDMLEPEQARDIGARVAESEMARELIERIRKVTRRRRLSSPPLLGEGEGDPNIVAEYLDNVLPPQEVAEIEERCLQSDLYLAELASCHQILSLVMGEPAYVPPTARARMYGLVRGRESFPNRKPPEQRLPPTVGEAADEDAQEYATTSERRKRLWVPVAVVGLAAALALAIWAAIPTPPETRTVANGYALNKTKLTTEPADKIQVKDQPKIKPDDSKNPKIDPNSKVTDPVTPEPKPKESANPEPKDPDKKIPEPKTKEPDPKIIDKQPLLRKPIPAPNTNLKEFGQLVTKETIVLTRKSIKDPWIRILPTKTVFTNAEVMALPGYRSTLELPTGIDLTLWGYLPDYIPDPNLFFELKSIAYTDLESKAQLHQPPVGYAMDVSLKLGRYIINNRKDGDNRVIVRFQNQNWDILLRGKNTEVVLSLISIYDPGTLFSPVEGAGEPPRVTLDFWVTKGQATLLVEDREPIEFNRNGGNTFISWDNRDAGLTKPEAVARINPLLDPDVKLPAYAEPAQRSLKKLSALLATPRDDFSLALSEVLATIKPPTPKEKLNELPLSILIVLSQGAMGELGRVIDAAGGDDNPTRIAALIALRHINNSSPEADLQIYRMLEKKGYGEQERKLFVSLLHEFSQEQIIDPKIHAGLIDGLRSRKIAIRELAFSHTQYFFESASRGSSVNLSKFYTPDMPESKRVEGLEIVEDAFKQLPEIIAKKK